MGIERKNNENGRLGTKFPFKNKFHLEDSTIKLVVLNSKDCKDNFLYFYVHHEK